MDALQAAVAAEVKRLHAECGDPFRRAPWPPLTYLQREYVDKLKDEAISTYRLVQELPASRERALALTHLETALMFAVKAATAPDALQET